jgi:hypothetical protein
LRRGSLVSGAAVMGRAHRRGGAGGLDGAGRSGPPCRLRAVASVLALTALTVLVGAGPSWARDEALEVILYQEAVLSEVELCAFDDRGELEVPDEVVDRIITRWPTLDRASLDRSFGCVYLEVADERSPLPTADGFTSMVDVPSMADLEELGFDEILVSVCPPAVEVTIDVEPASARVAGDGCFFGSRGAGLDPGVDASVTVTARASDAFVLRRALLVVAVLAGVGLAAGVAVAARRRLAVRWAGAPTWRWWTWGLLVGVTAGVATGLAALSNGLLEAVDLRFGFAASVVVAAVAGAIALVSVLGATLAIARVRTEPAVAAEARRRGYTEPTAADVPTELGALPGPPRVSVPSPPWWAAAIAHGPPALLWAAGLGALWIEQPGPLAVLALVAGFAGALLLWVRGPLMVAGLRSVELDLSRRAALLATAAELGLSLRDVRQATVSLPSEDDGAAMGMVVGRTLHLSPVLADHPPRRALTVAIAVSAEPAGLLPAWFGAAALAAGALLDLAWAELTWWALGPAALLLLFTLRWWWQGRRLAPRDLSMTPDEALAADLEGSWWSLAQAEPRWDAFDDEDDDPDVAWRLGVAAAQETELELGATPGTAITTARRLAAEAAAREQERAGSR